MIESLPSLKEIVNHYQLNASKKLGQNFLFDMNITDKIVRAAGPLSDFMVVEIGPGPGGLTRSILNSKATKIIAIEKDERCVNALNDYLIPAADGRLEIIHDDALKGELYEPLDGKIKIIANLPYNISTKLLFNWLACRNKFTSLTLMFQREVAYRIMAKPKTKDYGRLSVKTQWLCEIEHHFDIPPSAFYPPPKVTSSVITLTPRAKPLAQADESKLDQILRATFGLRRKTLKSSLKSICKDPALILKEANIAENCRPEELSVEQFCLLSRLI